MIPKMTKIRLLSKLASDRQVLGDRRKELEFIIPISRIKWTNKIFYSFACSLTYVSSVGSTLKFYLSNLIQEMILYILLTQEKVIR